MKRLTALLLILVLLTVTACEGKGSGRLQAAGGNFPDAPILILNDEKIDVYTSHYYITEEYAEIPLQAFLQSIGAETAESSLNGYGIQCYAFMGKRYIVAADLHLFMLEEDYMAFLEQLKEEGKELTRETAENCGLLPKNECTGEAEEYRADLLVDHLSLMNAFVESGVNITIQYDYATRTITVTLP